MPLLSPPLLLIRKRYALPHGNILYLPLREMRVGTSPNLLSNGDMEAGTTGWTGSRLTAISETTIIHGGAKSLKLVANDVGGAGAARAINALSSYANYLGITYTLTGWGRATSGNTYTQAMSLANQSSHTYSSDFPKDDTFAQYTVTRKSTSADTSFGVGAFVKKESDADTDDTAYFDDMVLTVPQMRSPNGVIVHPEGCVHNANGFLFDGTDDLITLESDIIGTSACTIIAWIYPTGWGEGSLGRICDNGKTSFMVRNLDPNLATMAIYSNGVNNLKAPNGSIALNTWFRVAATRIADGTAAIYINGTSVANGASGAPVAGDNQLCIGNNLAGSATFAGTIDDVQVYNRVLSATEIMADFTANRGAHL